MDSIVYQLLIYRNILRDDTMVNFCELQRESEMSKKLKHCFDIQSILLSESNRHLTTWRDKVVDLIVHDENVFSLKCERSEPISRKLIELIRDDVKILKYIYNFDWQGFLKKSGVMRKTVFSIDDRPVENLELHELLSDEDSSDSQVVEKLMEYYKKFGTGTFSNSFVFKWDTKSGALVAVEDYHKVSFDDLIGYEKQKKALIENTQNFILRGRGNNVLLYGPRGTGKSSSIKALIGTFGNKGLRIIEIDRSQLRVIPEILMLIKNRNYKFILYIDDLSFEDFETEYKYFKAVMEGSFEKKPDNLLIYVTSNRKHLIKESFRERDEDVHWRETSQEKLSLFDRFGISIFYDQPREELYEEMVLKLAEKNGVKMKKDRLLSLANEWKVSKSSCSGRTARQFIDSIL